MNDSYRNFVVEMQKEFPKMYLAGHAQFEINEGWFNIVRVLSRHIQFYIDQTNERRALLLKNNPNNVVIPDEVKQVVVVQLKEKFGGLRFYYNASNDQYISGLVDMASEWASHTCHVCGATGKLRRGSWIQVLCDKHEEEYQQRQKELYGDDDA